MSELTFEEEVEFRNTWNLFKSCYNTDKNGNVIDNNKFLELIPKGTDYKIKKDGSISFLDPITKRARVFNDIHALFAWLSIMEKKEIFKRTKE
jgi:hypothetical protein